MSNAVATVAFLQGQAWAKAPDGSLRVLNVGSVLNDDEVLVTAQGARVELNVGGVEPLVVHGGQEVAMSRDMNAATATSEDEALLSDASVQQALTVLEEGGDLLEELEETAAGDNGSTGGGSNSFVRLERTSEATGEQQYDYATDGQNGPGQVVNGGGYSNQAPQVTDQVLSSAEDGVLAGQIIATDVEGDTLSYAVTTAPVNGSVQLDPVTGQFTFTPNTNYNGSDNFVVTVTDSRGNSTTTTVTLNITAVNDAPVSADQNLATDEDTPLNGQISASDVEGDTLGYLVSGQPANGTVSVDAATGAFIYTPNANFNGGDSFVVTIDDGNGGTTTSTVTIVVKPVNDAPVSGDQNLTTNEETPIDGQIAASDVDGGTLGYTVSGQPANGTVTLNPVTGTFTYTPNTNFNGGDQFVVTISDGQGGTTTSTVTIGVLPVNDAPVSSDQNLTTNEETPIDGQIAASDVDGDTLGYTVSGQPANGTVTLNPVTGTFTYTPNANFTGGDQFVVTISDGQGGTTTSTVTIGVLPVNDAPVSSDQNLTTNEDTPIDGQIAASDVDGDTLGYTVSGQPGNGTVTLNPVTGTFTYTPNANFNGGDQFVVTISDGQGGTTTSTVTIGVLPVNDAPVSSDLNLITNEETPIDGQIVASDVEGDTLGYTVSGQPTNGTVTLNPATGTFTYTPNANFTGGDQFVVTINDGQGGTTTSTVTIGVLPVNDAPVSNDQNLTTREDNALGGQVNATDVDGDLLGFVVSGQPANGTVTVNPATGAFLYIPAANYNGNDSFLVTISDGNGGTTTSRINILVTPANDDPITSSINLTTPENSPVGDQVRATDVDGDTLSFSILTLPANGSVNLNPATGVFVYTPNANFNGSDTFLVTVSDGNGGTTTSRVNIGVTPLNDAPVAINDTATTDEGSSVTLAVRGNDSDPDGDSLTVSAVTQGANGSVVIDAVTGNPIYTPNAGFTGTDSFTYTINDGNGNSDTATVTVTVNPANQPSVMNPESVSVDEDFFVLGNVLSNDTDTDDTLRIASYEVDGNTYLAGTNAVIAGVGDITIFSTGDYRFTPEANYNGPVPVITYTTNTGSSSTLTITVRPVNDAPVAVNDTANVNEGASVTVAVRANDSDPEGDSLTVVSVSQGANGSVVIDAVSGNPIYTPNAGFSGNDSFTYTVQDPSGDTASATVDVVVNANAPSVLVQDLGSGSEDNDVTGNVLTNDTDTDDTLTVAGFQVAGLGSFSAGQTALIAGVGSLVVNTDGSYVFDPEANWNGAVPQVTYTTNTGFSSTLDITVTPVNDAPIAVDDLYTINEDEVWSMPLPVSGLVTNDSDPDGDSLRVVILENAVNGTLSVVSGNLVFTPNAEFSGTASFDYRVTDDNGGVDIGTVFINVVAVDDSTQAIDDVKTVAEGNNATGNVLTNDVDPDSIPQVVSFVINGTTYTANDSVTLPGVGQFTLLANGDYTFEPIDNNFNGAVPTVTYTTDTGASADLDITLTPVNDAPVAVDDTFTIAMNGTLSLPMPLAILVANDTDVDNDTLRVTVVESAANGTFQVVSGNLVFTPTPGFTGVASFNYIVTDDNGGFDSGRVNINVVAVPNQAPETNALNVSGDEDTLITINLAGSDSDGSVAGYVIKSLPANGLLYSDAAMTSPIAGDDLVSGPVYFMPAANWNGTTDFDYAAQDNLGLEDATPATVNISVNAVADVAVVGSGAGTVKEDTPAQSTTAGTLSVTDPDAGEEGFEVQSNTAGTYGSFSITSDGDWTYSIDNSKANVQQLKEGETKTEMFAVKSIDGTTSSVVITVTGTNDGPTAVVDTGTTLRNTALTFTPAELLGNDTDPDGDTLTIDSVQGAVNGNVALVAGNVVFVPTTGYHGPASFTYTISDGKGGSSTASVDITVVKPNTAPIAIDDNATGGMIGSGLISEYFGYREGTDGLNLTNLNQVIAFIEGRAPTATFVTTDFDYNPGNAFGNGLGNGTNLQTFLNNDAASLSNDPISTTDAIIRMRGFVELEAGTYNFRVLSDDGYQIKIDGVTVGQVGVNQVPTTTTHTSFTISTPGIHTIEIIYWDQGWNAIFSAELSDDSGNTYQPFSAFTSYQQATLVAVEDTPFSISAISLLSNDSDPDGHTLSIQSVQGATNGSVSLVAGSVVFTPAANYAGPASFTYTVSDSNGGTDTATVNLVVSAANDAPVAVDDSQIASVSTAKVIQASALLANDVDIDGDQLNILSVQDAVNGTVSLSGTTVTFTPTNGYEGPASFTYTARDPNGVTTTATVNLAVGSANAPTVVVNKSIVAIAQGTGGTSVDFPITTRLVDTDGSETLSVRVSGVPTGVSFNAGTNLGGGVWSFVAADLPNLQMNLPGSFATAGSGVLLTVQSTATEVNGGFTASTSSTTRLYADYTTTTATTTENGNLTGTSADNHIQGGSGANTISGGAGNDLIYGGSGNDTLNGDSGTDIIYGEGDNDTINGGASADFISGGSGNDSLSGGTGSFVDVFAWALGDQGPAGTPAVDTILDFGTGAAAANGGGDVLDLRDLLQGESVGAGNSAGNLADYLHFEIVGSNTEVHISHTGGFGADSHTVGGSFTSSAETQKIVLSGVDLQSIYSGATTDQQIITQLLNNNKLITD